MGVLGGVCGWNGCGKSAVYLNPAGERQTVLIFEQHSGRLIGPDHWLAADPLGESVYRQALARWPGFPDGWKPLELTEVEQVRLTSDQQAFRHALADVPTPRQGGLRRMDNSDIVDTGRGW